MLVRLSVSAWKWLVVALALTIGSMILAELAHGIGPQLRDRKGSLDVVLADQLGVEPQGQGRHLLRIDALLPGAALLASGARPGDRLRFDRTLDRWRQFAPDEPVGLTLVQEGAARHLVVRARPAPLSLADKIDYWGRAVVALPALLFAVLVGLHQPAGHAYRSLTLTFLALGTAFYFSFTYSAPGSLAAAGKVIQLTLNSMIWLWCASFALHYRPDRHSALRARLFRVLPAYRLLAVATAAYACWFGLGNEAPGLWLPAMSSVLGGGALLSLSLYDGWRNSVGCWSPLPAVSRHRS